MYESGRNLINIHAHHTHAHTQQEPGTKTQVRNPQEKYPGESKTEITDVRKWKYWL